MTHHINTHLLLQTHIASALSVHMSPSVQVIPISQRQTTDSKPQTPQETKNKKKKANKTYSTTNNATL